jgi:hypothetical protein
MIKGLHKTFALAWELLLGGAVWIMPFAVFSFILLFAYRFPVPVGWEYTVSASTEVLELELPAGSETRWLIDGAIICSRKKLADGAYQLGASAQSPCPGRAWSAYQLSGVQEQVLTLNVPVAVATDTDKPPLRIMMEIDSAGTLAMIIRGTKMGERVGSLSSVELDSDIELQSPVNLIWKTGATTAGIAELVFPFSGEVNIGRDIAWSDSRMLRNGTVSVFTASDKIEANRTLMDEAELVLGDQVRLDHTVSRDNRKIWPKGFVRHSLTGVPDAVIDVVAFGRADDILIQRFGDNGYSFKPGFWRRVLRDPVLSITGSALLIFLGVLGQIADVAGVQARKPSKIVREVLSGLRGAVGKNKNAAND